MNHWTMDIEFEKKKSSQRIRTRTLRARTIPSGHAGVYPISRQRLMIQLDHFEITVPP